MFWGYRYTFHMKILLQVSLISTAPLSHLPQAKKMRDFSCVVFSLPRKGTIMFHQDIHSAAWIMWLINWCTYILNVRVDSYKMLRAHQPLCSHHNNSYSCDHQCALVTIYCKRNWTNILSCMSCCISVCESHVYSTFNVHVLIPRNRIKSPEARDEQYVWKKMVGMVMVKMVLGFVSTTVGRFSYVWKIWFKMVFSDFTFIEIIHFV